MKKIKLFIYNYGAKCIVADFKNNSMEAVECMKHLNDNRIFQTGKPLENVFYYLEYQLTGKRVLFVDFTNSNLYPNNELFVSKIDGLVSAIS